MKTIEQIQRAHDLLEPIATGEVPCPASCDREMLSALCGVLCWALEDGNSEPFQDLLEGVEKEMAKLGYKLDDDPLPFPMFERPGEG